MSSQWLDNSSQWGVLGAQTLLSSVVSRVMRSCGLPAPASLAVSGDRLAMAISAVDLAAERVWNAAKWDWRSRWAVLEIDSGVAGVSLPSDFGEMGTNPVVPLLNIPMSPVTYQELVLKCPQVFSVPIQESGSDMADLGVILSDAVGTDSQHLDIPRVWAFYGDYVFWYPFLDTDRLADIDASLTVLTMIFSYFGRYDGVTDVITTGADEFIQIPSSLIGIVHHLATGYFGADLEFPSAGVYEARGEKMLREAIAKRRQRQPDLASFNDGRGSLRSWL